MKKSPLLLLLALAACAVPDQPLYMADALRSREDAARALNEIAETLGPGFRVRQIRDLFFVATNTDAAATKDCYDTIASVDDMLRREFFQRRPTRPLRVFVFRDAESYGAYVENTYGHPPTTPFGFYVSGERKMILNVATGTGTLAHELTHPLLNEDFPGVPPWFNEGFCSMFERYITAENGKPTALVNWRFPALRQILAEGRRDVIRPLLGMDYEAFYGEESGLHYAVARHLCLWLQDHGLLKTFYDSFKASLGEDRTGAATLISVTGMSLDRFESVWREWVLGLEFR